MSAATVIAPHMTAIERELFEARHTEECQGFIIVPKRDFGSFGYWMPEHRCNINAGWVVTYGSGRYRGCNAAPGATWSPTLLDAREMVTDLLAAGYTGECNTVGGGGNSEEFWRLNHARYARARLVAAQRLQDASS